MFKLDIFKDLEKNTKEDRNCLINNFTKVIEKNLENNNAISLLQKFEELNNITTTCRDNMYVKRNEILNNYAQKTINKGDLFFIYSKSTDKKDTYNICVYNKNKSHKIIQVKEKDLPKNAGIDSVLRMKNNKFILDKQATSDIIKQSYNEFEKLIEEQNKELKELRVEGHTYEVVEILKNKICLTDITKKDGNCFEEIDFAKMNLKDLKEGQLIRFNNNNYEVIK